MADEKVLDYHDILLRGADVELLRGPDWLNDQARCPQLFSRPHMCSADLRAVCR